MEDGLEFDEQLSGRDIVMNDSILASFLESGKRLGLHKWLLWPVLILLVLGHLALLVANVAAFFVLPIMVWQSKVQWYVAIPVMSFIWFFSTTRVECRLTQLENYIRRQLGLKRIGGFLGHYIKKPIWRLFGFKQRKKVVEGWKVTATMEEYIPNEELAR